MGVIFFQISQCLQKFLDKINYGNKDISGGISKFWLGSTLKISANEQLQFIKKNHHEEVPIYPVYYHKFANCKLQ